MQSMPVRVGTVEVPVLVAGTAPEALVEGMGTAEMLGVWLMPVLGLSVVVVLVAGTAEVVLVAGMAPEALVEGVGTAEMLGVWFLIFIFSLLIFFPFITFFIFHFILFDGIQLVLMKPGDVGSRWQDGGSG